MGSLVPLPGIEPGPSAVKAWSPNHWTAREFPRICILTRSPGDIKFEGTAPADGQGHGFHVEPHRLGSSAY